jgi:hypothetical protein
MRGLMRETPRRKRRFVQETYSLGSEQNFRWDKALAAAEAIEDEELSRRAMPVLPASRTFIGETR